MLDLGAHKTMLQLGYTTQLGYKGLQLASCRTDKGLWHKIANILDWAAMLGE